MQQLALFFSLIFIASNGFSQSTSVVVNADGTHSTIVNNGSTSLQINPDGTHSTIMNNGSTSIQINPDGTHSPIFHNGPTSIRVNPDGTHSTIVNNGPISHEINPGGAQTVVRQSETVILAPVRADSKPDVLTAPAQDSISTEKKRKPFRFFKPKNAAKN